MNVKELIDLLLECPSDQSVIVEVGGDTFEISGVDHDSIGTWLNVEE